MGALPAGSFAIADDELPISEASRLDRLPAALRVLLVFALIYGFLAAIGLMGAGFKALGKGFAERLIGATANPLLGLFVGVLATSVVQSSSLTTSILVGMVSAGTLTVPGAIPMVMGANIGTTVTNSLVSLGFVGDELEFRRAFACGTVHDFFNFLCVLLLLPVELLGQAVLGRGPLEWAATTVSGWLASSGAGQLKFAGPVKAFVKPVVHAAQDGLAGLAGDPVRGAWLAIGVSLAAVCVCLWSLTATLRSLLMERLGGHVEKGVDSHPLVGVVVGCLVTVLVQSSSITTSLLVPLAAAGALGLSQAFCITVGANIGTTCTAMLASLGGNGAGLTIALVHLFFNLTGAALFVPFEAMRQIPVRLATGLVRLTLRSRWWAVAYVGVLFFGIPALLMALF